MYFERWGLLAPPLEEILLLSKKVRNPQKISFTLNLDKDKNKA